MDLIRWRKPELSDPWYEFKRLQNEINDLFNLDRSPATEGLFDRPFSPAVDLVEGPEDYTVVCEIPGVDKKDLELSLTSNVLTIKGEKKQEEETKRKDVYRREMWKGSFQRTISLPGGVDNQKNIEANLKDGILTVVIPKREETKPRQITVKAR
ncbi:MAG: Hsp20/alpha crystallin family protein [Spirochaetales bacterium]|nr:Hsp20/alpha crystallin family protein [Spirochaetales bacterium]